MSPGVLPVTFAGLAWLWRRPGAQLRHIPIQFAVMLGLLMWSAQSRPDRLAGLYPLLFAAGGVWLGDLAGRRASVRVALPIWIAAWGLLLLPVGTPLLSPDQTAQHLARLGISHQSERGAGKRTALPRYFARPPRMAAAGRQCRRGARHSAARGPMRVAFSRRADGQASALDWLGEPRQLAPVLLNPQYVVLLGPTGGKSRGGHRAGRRP